MFKGLRRLFGSGGDDPAGRRAANTRPPEPDLHALLTTVTGAIADQERARAETQARLRTLADRLRRLEDEGESDYAMSGVVAEKQQLENLVTIYAANVTNLQTQRGAILGIIAQRASLPAQAILGIQQQVDEAQRAAALVDVATEDLEAILREGAAEREGRIKRAGGRQASKEHDGGQVGRDRRDPRRRADRQPE